MSASFSKRLAGPLPPGPFSPGRVEASAPGVLPRIGEILGRPLAG
jgi:hypothetical protein